MTRRLLVAEDDRLVAAVLEQMLIDAGFEVELAEDGLQAIAKVAADPSGFDLALIDLVMPSADGAEVMAAIGRLNPDLPVVLTSGHGEDYVRERVGNVRYAAFLPKPWRPQQLFATIGEILPADADGTAPLT
ncbi:MAG: response regulator [Burkholderiaceae bacterium]